MLFFTENTPEQPARSSIFAKRISLLFSFVCLFLFSGSFFSPFSSLSGFFVFVYLLVYLFLLFLLPFTFPRRRKTRRSELACRWTDLARDASLKADEKCLFKFLLFSFFFYFDCIFSFFFLFVFLFFSVLLSWHI